MKNIYLENNIVIGGYSGLAIKRMFDAYKEECKRFIEAGKDSTNNTYNSLPEKKLCLATRLSGDCEHPTEESVNENLKTFHLHMSIFAVGNPDEHDMSWDRRHVELNFELDFKV